MKTYSYIFILVLIHSSLATHAQNPKSSWEVNKLKGRVYSLYENEFTAEDKERDIWLEKYDTAGYLIEQSGKRGDVHVTLAYDKKRNVVSQKEYGLKNKLLRDFTFTYNDSNRLVKVVVIHNDSQPNHITTYRYTDKYNESGKLFKETIYMRDIQWDTVDEKTADTYDSRGNIIEHDSYSADTISDIYTYQYDSSGNEIREGLRTPNGYVSFGTLMKYDAHGNLIEGAEYRGDDDIQKKSVCIYDEHNNIIKADNYTYFAGIEHLESEIVHHYKLDEIGKPVRDEYMEDGKQVLHYLKYDKTGNWVLEEEFKNGKLVSRIKRKIKYY